MKPKTNNYTLLNKILCGVVLTGMMVADVLTIVLITMSPMWSSSIINAVFWSFTLVMTVGIINMFAWIVMKETFNN